MSVVRSLRLATDQTGSACSPDKAWCANCGRNGHPAYACPSPARQRWPGARPVKLPPMLPAGPQRLVVDEEGRWHSEDAPRLPIAPTFGPRWLGEEEAP